MKVTIDQEKCIHCGLCKKACILTRFCGFDSLEQGAEQHCIDCGHCVAVCPKAALTLEQPCRRQKNGTYRLRPG